jgi:hypothetical protein
MLVPLLTGAHVSSICFAQNQDGLGLAEQLDAAREAVRERAEDEANAKLQVGVAHRAGGFVMADEAAQQGMFSSQRPWRGFKKILAA